VNVGIIGVGLIGGSVAKALTGPDIELFFDDPDPETCAQLTTLGTVGPWRQWISRCDHVVVAVPLGVMGTVLSEVADLMTPHQWLVELSSVKGPLLEVFRRIHARTRLLPLHPMAGREVRGFGAADAELFRDHPLLAIDWDGHPPDAQQVGWWANRLGMTPHVVEARLHDQAMAWVSQLPYVVSAALRQAVGGQIPAGWLSLAGPGYRDTTRVGQGDPHFWWPVLTANRDELVRGVDVMIEELKNWRQALLPETSEVSAP